MPEDADATGPDTNPEIERLRAEAQKAGAEERWSDAEEALRAASDLYAAGGDGAGALRTRLQLAILQASTGHVDAALAAIDDCATSAAQLGEPTLEMEVHGAAANLLLAAERPVPAVARFDAGLALAIHVDDPRWQVQLRTGLATALFRSGENDRALEALRENAAVARTLADAVTAGMALVTVSDTMASVGQPGDALDLALEALAKFEEGKAGPFIIQTSIGVSNLYLVLGQPEKAATYTTQAVTLGRSFGGPSGEASVLLGLAMTASQRGDPTSARQFIDRATACLQGAGLPEPPELTGMRQQLNGNGSRPPN